MALPALTSNEPSPRTATLPDALSDADSIVTSLATDDESPTTLTGNDLNGALGGSLILPHNVTVTSAAAVGAYAIVDPIVVTGTNWDGRTISEELQLTDADGGEVLETTAAFLTVDSIEIPIQADDDGALEFGTTNIHIPGCREVRANSDGNLSVIYEGGFTDTLPCKDGEHHPINFHTIVADETTVAPLIIYF